MTAVRVPPPFYARLVIPGLVGGGILLLFGPITLVAGLMLPGGFEQFVLLMLAHLFLVVGSMAIGAALLIKQSLHERD
jgi:hypothetical protein